MNFLKLQLCVTPSPFLSPSCSHPVPWTDVSGAHGQVDRSSLSSVLRDLVKPGDENLREMNKKLQNMLEEQLTKNMHLQKVRGESLEDRPIVPKSG